ncbi:MAG: SLC13/DASS family transporter, partial [Flavobacteriales bacterium]|nr:SLC13/DASS family transporter [Flavobacteriales bacterium]
MEIQKRIGFFLGPAFFVATLLIQPFELELQNNVLAVATWMIVWWVVEVFPIYITAMLPMVFFPALGIMGLKETFTPYASPIVFLFLGGFLIALAMEERKLHQRIAFGLIRLTGTKPRGIILGFMAATAIVAMWISNTATTVMMLPIGLSVIALMNDQGLDEKLMKRFGLLIMLGIAYAANIGGTMTLIGTPPNLVFAGYYFEQTGVEFPFADWLLIGVPTGLTLLISGYVLLTKFIYPISNKPIPGVDTLFLEKWKELGKMKRGESMVLAVFGITVFSWIMLDPINELIGSKLLNNVNVAVGGGLLMFFVPVDWKKGEFIMSWDSTKRLPWGILILFGGGLSLASGLETAGIIDSIALWVSGNAGSSVVVICIGLTLLAIFLTEIMSNVALVTVLLPIVFSIANQMGADPLILTIPATLAASCAFMMPISTPPNAIVYSSGQISVSQMMRAGIWMNLIAVVIIVTVV